jgi:hypothetical protein
MIGAQAEYSSGTTNFTVAIMDGSNMPSNFTVKMNGTTLTYFFAYMGADGTLSPGDDVTLSIEGNGVSMTKTLKIPYAAAITDPTTDIPCNAGSTLPVTWTSVSPRPMSIYLEVSSFYTQSGKDWVSPMLPNDSTNGTIPVDTFPVSTSFLHFNLVTKNTAALSGSNVSPVSVFETHNSVSSVSFHTN